MNAKVKMISMYVLQYLLAFAFIAAGATKLSANPMMVENFANFGFASWFLFFIGGAELLGGLGLVISKYVHPKLPMLATIGLMIIMVGAIGTHIFAGDPIVAAIPAAVLFLLLGLHLKIINS